MSSFTGNATLALAGERWKAEILGAVERLDSPEAQMLAERMAHGESGEVESLLTVCVLAQTVSELRDRGARLEALQQ